MQTMAIFPMISKRIIVFISITVLSSMESNAFTTPSSSSSTTTTTPTTDSELSLKFPYRLSKERLGTKHDSLESFHRAITQMPMQMPMQTQTEECDSTIKIAKKQKNSKEYTLVIVTETIVSEMNKKKSQKQQPQPQQRILLGMKNRGFGTGKYNSFGGKFLHDDDDDGDVTKVKETVEECACRELKEETNIKISIERMKQSKIGIQRFTFEDNIQNEMIVHLFHTDLSSSIEESYNIIGCDEITPIWFDNFDLIPFDNMFADDSLWLTTLLSSLSSSSQQEPTTTTMIQCTLEINGSYHFKANCEETNTISHYYMDVRPRKINTT